MKNSSENLSHKVTWPISENPDFRTGEFAPIEWIKPTMENAANEGGEVERVVRDVFGLSDGDANYTETVMGLSNALLEGQYVTLSEEVWAKLENTDSHDKVYFGDVQKVKDYAKSHDRDAQALFDAAAKGNPVVSPVILKYGNKYHLVSGNTRLMVARATGQKPKVLIGEYSPS